MDGREGMTVEGAYDDSGNDNTVDDAVYLNVATNALRLPLIRVCIVMEAKRSIGRVFSLNE